MDEVFGLFPTPFMRAPGTLGPALVTGLVDHFAELASWSVKEMWVNVLDTGGHQAMHNHANSFISGSGEED